AKRRDHPSELRQAEAAIEGVVDEEVRVVEVDELVVEDAKEREERDRGRQERAERIGPRRAAVAVDTLARGPAGAQRRRWPPLTASSRGHTWPRGDRRPGAAAGDYSSERRLVISSRMAARPASKAPTRRVRCSSI